MIYVHLYLAKSFLEWYMIHKKNCRENQNAYFLFSNTFLRKSCHMWDTKEKHCKAGKATDDNIIRRMRFTCWITKTTHTQRICNTYYFTTAKIDTRKRLVVTLCIHCLSCFEATRDTFFLEKLTTAQTEQTCLTFMTFNKFLSCVISALH